MIHFLQQGHDYSNKAISPNSAISQGPIIFKLPYTLTHWATFVWFLNITYYFFSFICMCVRVCVSVCHICTSTHSSQLLDLLELEWHLLWAVWHGFWEQNSGPRESWASLLMEPSPQPPGFRFSRRVSCSPEWLRISYVAEGGLGHPSPVLLSLPPQCWDDCCPPTTPAL